MELRLPHKWSDLTLGELQVMMTTVALPDMYGYTPGAVARGHKKELTLMAKRPMITQVHQ